MNNILVLPMVIPLLTGILLVFLKRFIHVQRWLSVGAMIVNAIISLVILNRIQAEGILRLDFGEWLPPYGILFVADSFATLLVLTSSIVAAICLIYAIYTIGEEREKTFFYPFVNFLVVGVICSFFSVDLFNLFVNFEVMLVASYLLISLGGTKIQLKASLKYITINVLSSWIFLVAIAYLYGTLGTLNLAHLSELVAESGQTPLLTVISILFLLVFSLKSGLRSEEHTSELQSR